MVRVGFYKKKTVAQKTKKSLNKNVKGYTYSIQKVKGGYGLYKNKRR